MARYRGPKSKVARRFREPIFGRDKALEKKNYGPGQHGNSRRRPKLSEYAIQLAEKQKAKYTYGLLEKQFRNLFKKAAAKKGAMKKSTGMTAAQKKLPPFIQKAIMNKKKSK